MNISYTSKNTNSWPILLQTALKGKEQKAYVALSLSDCNDYSTVKLDIQKSYELVLEAMSKV